MTIQIPNPGTGVPADKTGDDPWTAMRKVKHNFEDQGNAASREVGTSARNVMEVGAFGLGGISPLAPNNLNVVTETGTYTVSIRASSAAGSIPTGLTGAYGVMSVIKRAAGANSASVVQQLYNKQFGESYIRIFDGGATWSDWMRVVYNGNNDIYQSTTASGANVVIDSNGKLMRSTSSERYKNILSPLELDDTAYANAMQLAPIVYRSTADADNPDYHYYSFSAEELGAYDPAFALWRDTETVTDADGNVTEQPLAERQAEGINLNAIVAFLHATNVKQGKLIADLERRLSDLEPQPEV